MKTKFNLFKENHDEDFDQMEKNVVEIKEKFSDYKDIEDFFNNVEYSIYKKKGHVDIGFGLSKNYSYDPIMKDISIHLFKNNFKLDIKEINRTYMSLYYQNYLSRFVDLLRSWSGAKKYYYYKTIKQYKFGGGDVPFEEKNEKIKSEFSKHKISERYDLSVDSPVSFIDVILLEK